MIERSSVLFITAPKIEKAKLSTKFHHDFKEISILELNDTDDYFYDLYLCVPAKDDYKGNMVLLVEEENQKYQPLYELSLEIWNNYPSFATLMSEKEVFKNVKRFCFLVDTVLSYSYGDSFNLKKELMSMRKPVKQNFLLALTTVSCDKLILSGESYYGAEPENINDLVSSILKRNIKLKPEIKIII